MKHLNSALIFGGLILTSAVPALANDTTSTPKPTGYWNEFRREIREETKDFIKNIKEIRIETRSEVNTGGKVLKTTNTENRREYRQNRVRLTFEGIKKSLTTRFDHLNSLKARIQTKITAQNAVGKNVTEAQAKINTYSDAVYKADLAAFEAKYKEMVDGFSAEENYKADISGLRTSANKVKTDLNDLRKILTDSLRLLIRAR